MANTGNFFYLGRTSMTVPVLRETDHILQSRNATGRSYIVNDDGRFPNIIFSGDEVYRHAAKLRDVDVGPKSLRKVQCAIGPGDSVVDGSDVTRGSNRRGDNALRVEVEESLTKLNRSSWRL